MAISKEGEFNDHEKYQCDIDGVGSSLHQDGSDYTFNFCLGKEFTGNELQFYDNTGTIPDEILCNNTFACNSRREDAVRSQAVQWSASQRITCARGKLVFLTPFKYLRSLGDI